MTTRKVDAVEIDNVVRLHMIIFNDFFLTSLGKRFLKIFYKACLNDSKNTVAVGLYDDNQNIVGLAFGSLYSKGYYKKILINNLYKFLGVGLYLLLTKPQAIVRLAKNLDKIKNAKDYGNYCELLSIGIDPTYKGKGYGKILLKAYESAAKERNAIKIALTTDAENNHNIISFYQNLGYEIFYEFSTFPNRKMYKFIKNI